MPKVSIIMPVYNKARYLTDTLNAIITQSFQDWELILVDDGSTDNGSEKMQLYAAKDNRIRIITQPNKGVSSARNTGLDNACGEWIWFVDADDLPDRQFLSHVFSVSYRYLPDLIIGEFEKKENRKTERITIKETGYLSAKQLPALFMKYQYTNGYFGYLWNKLIRHQLLKEQQLRFDPNVSLAEDLKFLTALYRADVQCELMPYVALRYTIGSDSALSQKPIDYMAQLEIQLSIKIWIIDGAHQNQYLPFFKSIISMYAACVIFHGYTDHLDCTSMGEKLLEMNDVSKMLCTRQIEPALFPIVWCLKNHHLHWMQQYLCLYHRLRTLYRKIKGESHRMRFVMYNHIGSANHGCEALVRTVPQLFDDASVILLSDAPEEEKRYHTDALMPVYPAKSSCCRSFILWMHAYLKLKLSHNYFYMDLLPYRAVKNILSPKDVLVSIGGDIFCYPDYPKYLLLHRHLMRTARHSLLIGCSIEPEKLKDPCLLKTLRSFDLITVREHMTLHFLREAGLKKICFCPDTAFLLTPQKTALPDAFMIHQTVGINISPLILDLAGEHQLILKNIEWLIREILNHTSFSIALIPHVVRADNDDRIPLQIMYEQFKQSERVCMISDHSAPELKWIISKCRYFIGTRTHAVIAAYSTGVPAIALGYSIKAHGIAKDLFGTDANYVLHYSQITTEKILTEMWWWLVQNETQIKDRLMKKTIAYQKRIADTKNLIRNILKEKGEPP